MPSTGSHRCFQCLQQGHSCSAQVVGGVPLHIGRSEALMCWPSLSGTHNRRTFPSGPQGRVTESAHNRCNRTFAEDISAQGWDLVRASETERNLLVATYPDRIQVLAWYCRKPCRRVWSTS